MNGKSLLALDLGATTGWAVHLPGVGITSGIAEFKNSRFEGGGMPFLKFHRWISSIHKAHPVGEIVFEEVRRHAGTTAAHAYGGFLACLTAWAEVKGVPYLGVPVGTIKRHATGKGNAGKEAVIAAMCAKGHEVSDHNQADALAIIHWALDPEVVR